MEEVWKPVVGYEGLYEVSNLGRVKSLSKKGSTKEIFLKQREIKGGYLLVVISKNNKRFGTPAHRLVAKAFIANPLNKPHVNHLDFNKKNNVVENLEWVTPKENSNHSIKNYERGELRTNSVLTKKQVLEIRKKHKPFIYSERMLSKEYGVARITIRNIIKRKLWKHI